MMNKLYKIPFQILGYKLYRLLKWPELLPINVVLSVTRKCNSKCKICNLWRTPCSGKELTVGEWKKVFKNLGNSVVWLTFSGGDQFLRKDFYKIINTAVDLTKPCLVNMPLSNRDVDKTIQQIANVLEHNKVPLIVNISLDGTEHVHNLIRGKKNSFAAMIKTFQRLKDLKKTFPQLFVCFHTVISNENICSLDELHKLILSLQPDYWTLEPFQQRVEFNNMGESTNLDYQNLFLRFKNFSIAKKSPHEGILKMKHITRNTYYFLARKTVQQNRPALPCYAAIASVQISPEGHVWQCGTKCSVLGNLRKADYDLKKIFFSEKADQIRKEIREEKCFCVQSNAFYTNLICNPSSFAIYFLMKSTRLKC